jgi:hypothetical protein
MKHRTPRDFFTRILFLASALALIGHHAFHADEPPAEEPFQYDRTESVLFVNLSGPQGTVLSTPTATLPVEVIVERHSWEIWKRPSTGAEEARPLPPVPAMSVTVNLNGHLGTPGNATVTTDSWGRAQTSFTANGTLGNPSVQATVADSTATLNFSQPGEDWTFVRTEGTIRASLAAPAGATGLIPGENRNVVLTVLYETWNVEMSNYGNTRTVQHATSPAVGAFVNWSTAGGDAYVSGSWLTDGQGRCETQMVMGSVDSVIRTDVTYATGDATHATLHLAAAPAPPAPPAENPVVLLRSETRPVITAFSPEGSSEVVIGESRNLVGTVRWDVWDIWGNGTGPEEGRYNYSYSANWVPVNLAQEQGSGSLPSSMAWTDWNGNFTIPYTMGSTPARITASVSGASDARSLDLVAIQGATGNPDPNSNPNPDPGSGPTEPQWQVLETRGRYTLHGPEVDGPTYDVTNGTVRNVSFFVTWDSWDVLIDPATGTTRDGTPQSSRTGSVSVELSVTQGDGRISGMVASTVATDGNGDVIVPFQMGNEGSRLTATIPGTDQTVSVDFTPPPASGPDSYRYVREEGLVTISLSSDPISAPVMPGIPLPIRAYAHSRTWEVWENAAGQTDLRNACEGPAISANVTFSIPGTGLVYATTEAGGLAYATVMPTSDPTYVTASVSFRGASANAELVLTPTGGSTGGGTDPGNTGGGTDPGNTGAGTDPGNTGGTGTTATWAWQSTHDELLVDVEPGDTAGTLVVSVQQRTYEIWRHPEMIDPEIRTVSVGPAQNAEVVLSSSSGSATFATGPHYTQENGRATIAYSASEVVTVQATANFAGMTGMDGVSVQPADGLGSLNPGLGGGGSGPGGSGPGPDGTGGPANPTGGTEDPNISLPKSSLQGRTHVTQGGGGSFAGFYGGIADQLTVETRYRSYRIELVRDLYDFEHAKIGEECFDLIAPADEFNTEFENKLNDGWRKLRENDQPQGLQPYQHTELIYGTPPTWQDAQGWPFWSEGPTLPGFAKGQVGELATEAAIRPLYEDEERFHNDPPLYWSGSVTPGNMGFPGGWTALERRNYGRSPYLGAPEISNHANFQTGIVPDVRWSEYWLQADGPVPDLKTVERTLLIRAVQEGEEAFEEVGTVTFTIPGTKDLSEGLPRISGLSRTVGWVEARIDGTLLLKPPVARGMNRVVSLLPIDIKVHQTQNGPQGSAPKYNNAPQAYIASNLFSVWPNEEAIVKVKLPPPFDQPQNLPANLVNWEVPGHTIPDNTLEAPLSWTLGFGNNTKEVKITIGGSEFKLHFKVQGVGILSELEAAALVPNASPIMLAYRQEAIDFGTTYPAGPQDDAMRHAYWCSVSVSTFPVTAGDVDLISTGHEYSNRYDDQQQAFNSTMDLKNNAVGMSVNHQVNGLPDRAAIRTELEQRYNAGEMYIWEIPRGAPSRLQQDSEGILIKSNGSPIH